MLKFGNKEFRNLQEQVKKNMDDILFILQEEGVLNEFGIKVIGQEDSAASMPSVADYKENNPDWAYGDAYAIGTEDPYKLYILTRANGTHPDDYWFDIGEFPVPGPQGPQGEQGPQGPQGATGNPGVNGTSAGFGTVTASAISLDPTWDAQVSVVTLGPDTAKDFSFTFGIPRGEPGEAASMEWGDLTGDIDDQTDLVNALQAKQNTLVSGTNIKTINNQSLLGSGNITITGAEAEWGSIIGTLSDQTDLQTALDGKVNTTGNESIAGVKTFTGSAKFGNVNVSGDGSTLELYASGMTHFRVGDPSMHFGSTTINDDGSIVCTADDYGVDAYLQLPNKGTSVSPATIAVVGDIPTAVSDLTNDAGYITGISSSDVTTALGYTPVNPSSLAAVATSGDYDDLLNKPTIPTVDYPVTDVQVDGVSVLNNKVAEITMPDLTDYVTSTELSTELADYVQSSSLGTAAYIDEDALSIAYSQITGTPTIPTATSDLTNDSGFITSSDLSGYATETWVGNQGYAVAANLATVATSGSYADLSNKPSIPTQTSDLTNDSGFIDKDVNDLTYYTLTSSLSTVATTGDYDDLLNKPTIPTVNNATLTIQKNGTTVNTFTANASSDVTANIIVPTATSDLNNDSGFITKAVNDLTYYTLSSSLATVATSGSYNDLSNTPSIPTDTSDLTNGAGFITSSALNGYAQLSGGNIGTYQEWTGYNQFDNGILIGKAGVSNVTIQAYSTGISTSLGSSGRPFTYAYIDYLIDPRITRNNTTGYGLRAPDTTAFTADKTIATTDQLFSGSYTDLSNKPTLYGTGTETWTFTLSDNTTVTKTIVLG